MALDFLKVRTEDAVLVSASDLRAQAERVLVAIDVPPDHARITADALVSADLRGVDTHGVTNLVRYTNDILEGRYTIPQQVEVLAESPSTALLSNGNGLGYVGAHRAMTMAMEKARATGVGQVTVRDGHHIGMAAYYPLMAIEQDMIGMTLTNSTRHTRPVLGAAPRVGTNPIAFAAPAGRERPFVLDMATSTIANGKVGLARRLGVPLPVGWVVDDRGQPIAEPPKAVTDEWALNPLGNTLEQGGHKGYGLGVMVDILTGVLSGGGYSGSLNTGENMTWVMAMDIQQFRPLDDFKAMMDEMIANLHATPPEDGAERVLVAGDPEADTFEQRSREGIPLHRTLVEEICARADQVGATICI